MKKRYLASPLVILLIALAWNIAFKDKPQVATAEEIQRYVNPATDDPRHPIEVFQLGPEAGNTESDVLAHLPTTIYPEDKIEFVVEPGWGLGALVHVHRAFPVTVKDGKKTLKYRTWATTVGELLDDVNRPLGDLDKANYTSSTPLQVGMIIEITRVAKTNVTIKEVIPFDSKEVEDPNEYRGVTKVTQQGENGERTKVFEVTREDGEEVSRKLIKNDVTKQPKQKITTKGTKLKIGRTFSGQATWYSARTQVAMNALPNGTTVRITNKATGKSVIVKVDDKGGFAAPRVVDLNPSLFAQLGGTLGQGIMSNVLVEEVLNP